MAADSNTQITPPDQTPTTHHRYSCCCLPITRSDATWFRSLSHHDDTNWWWGRSVRVLLKFREWSELVAGPRWKTFIRRFNRNRSGTGRLNGPFNYDPLSYALNFDEGQNGGQFEVDANREFSARYAAVPRPGGGGG